jgi:hypothetical protein
MKKKITISLEEDLAERLRLKSIEKYGNARSFSLYIEDLANGIPVEPEATACSFRNERILKVEDDFNKDVQEFTDQIMGMGLSETKRRLEEITNMPHRAGVTTEEVSGFFAFKEAFEKHINQAADKINACYSCEGLTGPVPKYENAGKNFEIYLQLNHFDV